MKFQLTVITFSAAVNALSAIETAVLSAIVEDINNNLSDYVTKISNGNSPPAALLSLYQEVQTYTDDSYTTLCSEVDMNDVWSCVTTLDWYSTRLSAEIASASSSAAAARGRSSSESASTTEEGSSSLSASTTGAASSDPGSSMSEQTSSCVESSASAASSSISAASSEASTAASSSSSSSVTFNSTSTAGSTVSTASSGAGGVHKAAPVVLALLPLFIF